MTFQQNPGDPLFEPPSSFDIWMAQEGIKIMIAANSSRWCYICDKKNQLQKHHIIPMFFGGLDVRENKVKLCDACHKKLHNHNDHHWSERYWLERLENLRTKHLNSSNNNNN